MKFHLTAMITYYGRHYSTYCFHSHKKEWIYFDDAKFRKVLLRFHILCSSMRLTVTLFKVSKTLWLLMYCNNYYIFCVNFVIQILWGFCIAINVFFFFGCEATVHLGVLYYTCQYACTCTCIFFVDYHNLSMSCTYCVFHNIVIYWV